MKLLVLSSVLEPKDNFKSFKVDAICKHAKKFYREDFNEWDVLFKISARTLSNLYDSSWEIS